MADATEAAIPVESSSDAELDGWDWAVAEPLVAEAAMAVSTIHVARADVQKAVADRPASAHAEPVQVRPLPPAAIATPTAWRAVALLFLGSTIAAGAAAAKRIGPRGALGLAAIGIPALVVPVAIGSRRAAPAARRLGSDRPGSEVLGPGRPWSEPLGRGALGSESLGSESLGSGRPTSAGADASTLAATVIVAARDERQSLPHLLADLGWQDLVGPDGRPAFEVIVIDDRSVDGTGDVARVAADSARIGHVTTVVRREGDGLPDGKGAALMAWPVDAYRGDLVVVLDADARVGRGYLRGLVHAAAAGHRAMAGRIRVRSAGDGIFSRLQDDEQALDGEIQRARWTLGGCSELRGNGIVVDRSALIDAGGWRPSLAEDLDLSTRLAICGQRVAWLEGSVVGADPVRSGWDLYRQRTRWAEGSIRRLFEHGPNLVGQGRLPLRTRLDFGAYSAQLAVPGLLMGAVVGAVRTRRPWAALGIASTYAVGLALLAADALRPGPVQRRAWPWPERLGRGACVAGLSTVWLVAVPEALLRLALRRGPVGYAKMEHPGAAGDGGGPGCEDTPARHSPPRSDVTFRGGRRPESHRRHACPAPPGYDDSTSPSTPGRPAAPMPPIAGQR